MLNIIFYFLVTITWYSFKQKLLVGDTSDLKEDSVHDHVYDDVSESYRAQKSHVC